MIRAKGETSGEFCVSREEESSEVRERLEGFMEEVRSWAETRQEYSIGRGVKEGSCWGTSRGRCCMMGNPLGRPSVLPCSGLIKHSSRGPRLLRDEGKKHPPKLKGNLPERLRKERWYPPRSQDQRPKQEISLFQNTLINSPSPQIVTVQKI